MRSKKIGVIVCVVMVCVVALGFFACGGAGDEPEYQEVPNREGLIYFGVRPVILSGGNIIFGNGNLPPGGYYVITSNTQLNRVAARLNVGGVDTDIPLPAIFMFGSDNASRYIFGYTSQFFSQNVLILFSYMHMMGPVPMREIEFRTVVVRNGLLYFVFDHFDFEGGTGNLGPIKLFSIEMPREIWERYEFGGRKINFVQRGA